jgi:signal transduction histidine kinase
MRVRAIVTVIAVVALAQVGLAFLVWRASGGSAPSSVIEGAVRSDEGGLAAMERVGDLLATSAFRAVITADNAALNALVKRSAFWPEVAFVSVEGADGKVLAHTDPRRVGRAVTDVPSERPDGLHELVVPMSSGTRTAGVPETSPGQVRVGYLVVPRAAPGATPGERPYPLAAILGLAAAVAIPVGFGVLKVAGRALHGPDASPIDLRHVRTLKQAKWMASRAMRETESIRRELGEREEELDRLREELATASSELADTRDVLADREARGRELGDELAAGASALAAARVELGERTADVDRARESLGRTADQLEAARAVVEGQAADGERLQGELATASGQLSDTRRQLEAQAAETHRIADDLARAAVELATRRAELEERGHEVDRLREERARASTELAEAQERLQARATEVGRLNEDLALFADDLAEARRALDERGTEAGRLSEELASSTQELTETRAALGERGAELDQLREGLARSDAELDGARATLEERAAEVRRLGEELAFSGDQLVHLRAELEARGAEVDQLRTGFSQERQQFAEELTRLSAQLIEVNRDTEALEAELVHQRAELDRARAGLDRTRADLEQARGELDEARAALAAPPIIPRDLIEQELKQLHSRAVACMSYAVRGSLTNVLGFSRLLLREVEGPLNETQKSGLLTIYEAGHQLLNFVNDLVDLARVDAKTLELREETIDVPTLVREVAATGADLLHRKPAEIAVECPATLPSIRGDRKRLKQILLTLMQQPRPNGAIAIDARADGGSIAIRLAHPETALPPETLAGLFDPLTLLDPAFPVDDDGGRLRLSLARSLATLSGGALTVEGGEGAGTTFTLRLPAAQPVA